MCPISNYKELIPEHVRKLGCYTQGAPLIRARHKTRPNYIKLASNENPLGPSPLAIKAIQGAIATCSLYPDNEVNELRQELARQHQVLPEHIFIGAGSTEILGVICRTLLRPGLNAITSERSFIMYPIVTTAAGARLITAPMRGNAFDLDAIAAAVDSGTRVILLANPNNPTGTAFDAAALEKFIAKIPESVLVVLDEAYFEFADAFASMRGVEYSRSLEHVKAGRNLVVVRSFSKLHGLAGTRVGYGIGPPELIGYFSRMRTTFSVSTIAQTAALAALRDRDHIRRTLTNNSEGSKQLTEGLERAGHVVIPTWANFLYCELEEEAALIAARLESEGVIVRPLTVWGAPKAIRITIGTPQQNETFLRTFAKITANRLPTKRTLTVC